MPWTYDQLRAEWQRPEARFLTAFLRQSERQVGKTDLLGRSELVCRHEQRSNCDKGLDDRGNITQHIDFGCLLVGYLSWLIVLDEGQIGNVCVHPNYRCEQIGEQLLHKCISLMEEDGINRLTLDVRETNLPARRLYEKVGFYEVGRRPNYYFKPSEAAILMDFIPGKS